MAITSINPTSVLLPLTLPGSEIDQPSQDLNKTIKENMGKSMNYQIIDKILMTKEQKQKQDEFSVIKNTAKSTVTRDDSLILSSTAQTLPTENNQVKSTNLTTIQLQEQHIEQRTARLSFSSSSEEEPEIKRSDPLAFDLDGNGLETTGIKQGIQFDIDADGKTEQTSFIGGNDAFLAYDKNGNGIIDNGSELFGDQNGAANGFEELKKYDDNKDGIIDKNDAIYSRLKLLSLDKNNQQKTSSLADHNIQSINLNYTNQHQAINYYDSIEQTGQFKRSDGSNGSIADIMLAHK